MFVYDFLRTLVSFLGPVSLQIEDVTVQVTSDSLDCEQCEKLEMIFRPCHCDAGHPLLAILRPFPKACSCGSFLTLATNIKPSLAILLIAHGCHNQRQAEQSSRVVSHV